MARWLIGIVGLGLAWGEVPCWAEPLAEVKARFQNPSQDYASAPLWVWNDWMTEENVRSGLRDLAAQKVRQAIVHPRPGLMTPYLSDEWFRLWGIALDEAKRLDMNVWIYDENSYPSGFAGGWVPEAMPDSRVVNIAAQEHDTLPVLDDSTLAAFRLRDGGAEYVTRDTAAGAEGPFLVVSLRYGPSQPWFGGTWYVDLLRPGVTEKFLEVTLEAYRKHLGEEFGKRIPGSFTDEPNLSQAGGLPWTPGLPELFEKRWGYSLVDQLPSLFRPVGDWRQVRYHYYQLVHEQFVARWAKPYHDYCEAHGLEFTGHYWEHEWPNCLGVPDNMGMYAWSQRPAIDILFNQYQEHNHAQVGNVRAVKELASVANQLGRKRTLCEAYGGGGWDLRLEDMKRIGDWLYVLGVNTLDEHLSDTTLRGSRKYDYPQSFSYHASWWEAYHCCAEYFTRLSAALSAGQQVNAILVIEPTTTAWMYQVDPSAHSKREALGESFFQLVLALERAQVEFDLGSEAVMADHGSVDPATGLVRVGERVYHTVILPQDTETLNRKTVELLQNSKATILCAGERPALVEGRPVEILRERVADDQANLGQEGIVRRMVESADGSLVVRQDAGDEGILFHHRRRLDGGVELVFLVNSSLTRSCSGSVATAARGVEAWDLVRGTAGPYPFEPASEGKATSLRFELPPAGSLLLALTPAPCEPGKAAAEAGTALAATGPVEIRRVEPNVLTLDYCDVTAGGETQAGMRVSQASQFVFRKNGAEGNPWDRAVQLHDRLITQKFPEGSGLEVSYRFTIEGAVPRPLQIVVERPDLYAVTCNGKPVQATEGQWWLDKAFGRIDITAAAQEGENVVTLKASPLTIWHEVTAAYVLGEFALQPSDKGFIIVPPRPLVVVDEKAMLAQGVHSDGAMWLSAGIGYGGRKDAAADDRAPWVVFDLGKLADLGSLQIWNYNENYAGDLTGRGVDEMEIAVSATGEPETFHPVRTVHLAKGKGVPAQAETVKLEAKDVRYVRLGVLSNHAGTRFPAEGQPEDNGFAGLGEVRFFAPNSDRPLEGVSAKASSELASHNRLAGYLVDGSGLSLAAAGWNEQGLPFYGHGVRYRQRFEIAKPEGRYRVVLPQWSGSAAKVLVNGQLAGWIAWQPYACDVTEALRPGSNEIEVVVIGTLKNTIGPHHGGAVRGIASPWHFDSGKQPGPPPGRSYDTISYGLFAAPVLEPIR